MTYEIRTKRWDKGLEVWVYQDGLNIGVTQTYKAYEISDAIEQARDWITITKDLPSDAPLVITHSQEAPTE